MNDCEIPTAVAQLEASINAANAEERIRLQPKFSRALQVLAETGHRVPPRLRNLNAVLLDEAIESRFDNMPL